MTATSSSLRRFARVIVLFTLEAMSAASPSRAACYSTPRAAMDALITVPASASSSENDGYKVTGMQLDRVLARRWAMITRCDHPEWPAMAFLADEVGWLGSLRTTQHSGDAEVRTALI